MRVLVTGARGRIGRLTVGRLRDRGDEVVAVDRSGIAGVPAVPGIVQLRLDATRREELREAARGCDALVHLAAIPGPMEAAPDEVFGNNVTSTYVALQALEEVGGSRAVVASSLAALGMGWAPRMFSPRYVPIDEEHPLSPAECYGLSKEVSERTAEMFCRRGGMSVLSLRFPFAGDPEQRADRVARTRADPGIEMSVRDVWSYVYPEDVASACVLGIHAGLEGFVVLNIGAADTLSDVGTMELVRRYHPETEVREEIVGTSAAFSISKANRLVGFVPAHSWRDEPGPGDIVEGGYVAR